MPPATKRKRRVHPPGYFFWRAIILIVGTILIVESLMLALFFGFDIERQLASAPSVGVASSALGEANLLLYVVAFIYIVANRLPYGYRNPRAGNSTLAGKENP